MKKSLLFALFFLPSFTLAQGLPAFPANLQEHTFTSPIDALSIGVPTKDLQLEVSALVKGEWTGWNDLHMEDEQDPLLFESNLVTFPGPATAVRFRGTTETFTMHPIRVSASVPSYKVAATMNFGIQPRILSRSEWGADNSLLLKTDNTTRTEDGDAEATPSTTTAVSNRVRDCQENVKNYPNEFKTNGRVTTDADGKALRWPQEYSPSIKLLVVHHTAQNMAAETRPGAERMRALYTYHAQSRGWGDIGYHYVVDEKGQIYESRAGGALVVGGHAYCNNTGTIGVAMMGNFDLHTPTQAQIDGLQWLFDSLAKKYDIDLEQRVTFHGKILSPIVGHRDLLSTDCPGYYVAGAMNQIRLNVASSNVFALVNFPSYQSYSTYVDKTDERRQQRLGLDSSSSSAASTPSFTPARADGVFAAGGTELLGRPGEMQLFSLRYVAGNSRVLAGTDITSIKRSAKIALWQENADGAFEPVINTVTLPVSLNAGEAALVRMKVQFPLASGNERLTFGSVIYTLSAAGRRARAPTTQSTMQIYTTPAVTYSRMQRLSRAASSSVAITAAVARPTAVRPPRRVVSASSSSARSSSASSIPKVASSSSSRSSRGPALPLVSTLPSPTPSNTETLIRIRLSHGLDGKSPADAATVTTTQSASVNYRPSDGSPLTLSIRGADCVATERGIELAAGIVRIDPGDGISTIGSWLRTLNRYRGILECRVIDGKLALINELPIEDYLSGLAEEDDSQPWEKQRAFAIAARSYAAYYLDASHRKFPGKPYDGSDSPAEFQSYGGYVFELRNANWVKAARNTAGQVLLRDGLIVRAPYFSSDDGRTRSPEERGWKNFPNADIFASKPDPWCNGMPLNGHGVGMSGCGGLGQAKEGKSAEEILAYYFPQTTIGQVR